MSRRILTLSGVIALLAGLVAVAAPGFAFSSKSTATKMVPKFREGAVTAKCPAGQKVAFGGMSARYHQGAESIWPTGMRRTDGGHWTAYGQSLATNTGSRLTATAYCAAVGPSTAAFKTVPVPGHRVVSAVATCPAGTVVVAAGFRTLGTPHFGALKALERIADDKLRVTFLNVNKGTSSITTIAYCGPGPAPIQVTGPETNVVGHGATARAVCPVGMELVFGGHRVTTGPMPHNPHLVPFGFAAETVRSWAVAVHKVDSLAGKATALAYCR